MADKLYKVDEAIELGYQAPNAESGLSGVIAEIYLPDGQKDSNFPDVILVEVGTTGTYRGAFTPNEQGTWQVIMHKADGDGQVAKFYSVGGYNVDSVGQAVIAVDTAVNLVDAAVGTVDSKVTTVDGKVDNVQTKVNEIDTTLDALDSQVDGMDTQLNTVEGKVTTVDSKVDGVKTKTDALPVDPASATNVGTSKSEILVAIGAVDTKVSALDTPPMAF